MLIIGRVHIPDALREVVELAPTLERASSLILIPHAENLQAQTLHVPVGDARDVSLVETGTVVVILVAFAYLFRAIGRAQYSKAVNVVATKKE
jgi:PIG-X / PBN1